MTAAGATARPVTASAGELPALRMHRHENVRRRARVGAVREGMDLAGPAAERNGDADAGRIDQSVEREPDGGRMPYRLDPNLDQVRVVGVRHRRRIGVGAVRRRELVVVVGPRVGRVGGELRAVIVVEVVLVEVLTVTVGRRAGDEQRCGVPDAGVLQLRGDRRGLVEDWRSRTLRGSCGAVAGPGKRRTSHGDAQRGTDRHDAPAWSHGAVFRHAERSPSV